MKASRAVRGARYDWRIMTVQTLPRIGAPELCSRCDSTVAKAKTRSGKTILMDFHPSQLGKFVIIGEDGHNSVVAMVAKYLAPNDSRARYACHWDRCKGGNTRRNYGRREINYSPFA